MWIINRSIVYQDTLVYIWNTKYYRWILIHALYMEWLKPISVV